MKTSVRIKSDRVYGEVYINDSKVSNVCSGYTLSHHAGELPRLELDINASNYVAELKNTYVQVNALKVIASTMDREEFEEFCDIWHHIHKEKHIQIELTDEEKQILAIADKYLIMSIHNNLWE